MLYGIWELETVAPVAIGGLLIAVAIGLITFRRVIRPRVLMLATIGLGLLATGLILGGLYAQFYPPGSTRWIASEPNVFRSAGE